MKNNNLLDKEFKVIIIKGYSMNSKWNEHSEKFKREFGNIRASLVAQMVKNLPAMQETCKRPGFDPWVGKIPQHGNGYPLHYSCLKNSMDRGAWQATVHGIPKSQT